MSAGKNRIAISDDIFAIEGKYFEECSEAILYLTFGEEEKKYYCSKLSEEALVWEE